MSAPVFSYAQAAKGLGPSPQTTSNVTSSASSEHGTKDLSQPDLSTSQHKGKPSANKLENESGATTTNVDLSPEAVVTSTKNKSEGSAVLEQSSSRQSSPHSRKVSNPDIQAVSASQTQTDFSASVADNPPETAVQPRHLEDQNSTEGTFQTSEVEKGKDTDEDWEKVSIPSVAAEKELKAAPIPMVNIWQQRRDAQAAKLKETAPQRPAAPSTAAPKQKPLVVGSEDNKRKAGGKDQINTDSTATPRRVNSGNRPGREQGSNHTSPRIVSQKEEKSSSSVPPSVGDVESWPTPETAQTDERRRSTVVEKIEKPETNEQRSSGQKNKWTPIPFVPSVKFETQLPPAAQSRRGGRAANRGRGSGLPGQGNKSEPGSMGPPPLPKQSTEQDRGRKAAAARSNRASSVPTDGSRPNNESNSVRKFSVTPAKDQNSTTSNRDVSNPSTPVGGGRTSETGNADHASRSPSRKANRNLATQGRGDHESAAEYGADIIEPTAALDSLETAPPGQSQSDFIKGENQENYRAGNDVGRERGLNQNRDWTKDRTSSSREKNDSWRERREPRSDRGRGNFRGHSTRGGYSNTTTSSSSHPYTSPLPQNGFEAPRNTPSTESRSRQSSQPFGPSPSFSASRNNPRSQSIPVSMIPGGYYQPMQGYSQQLSPISTDMNYGPYGQMHSGILSAMPYQDQLGSFALMSMVTTQLEYYFSLDNLCKDMFLRKNMDSQGYVPLRVIADFRRIKALLGDGQIGFDQLRSVCQQARNIELVTVDDGETLLRSRENWRDFILPIEERLPSAQNDGPSAQSLHQPPSSMMSPEFAPTNIQRSPPPHMNGLHDSLGQHMPPMSFIPMAAYDNHPSDQYVMHTDSPIVASERRSSTTSPLSKVQSPTHELARVLSSGLANGHRSSVSTTSDKENTFPDESVAVLKVVVRDPDYQGELSSDTNDDHSFARVSGLRGGASSPAQLERIRSLQFGQNIPQSRNLSDQTVYWTQGEGSIRPGYVHEEYLTLRDKAQSQRAEKHFDGALLVLYPLWADFLPLPHQFNVSMYEDFKTWALEDFESGNNNGKKHLVRFYDAMLTSKIPMTERIATDIVSIARSESGNNRDLWHKLRAAWRNGATNFKTRKRLTDLLSSEEQTELDRGV